MAQKKSYKAKVRQVRYGTVVVEAGTIEEAEDLALEPATLERATWEELDAELEDIGSLDILNDIPERKPAFETPEYPGVTYLYTARRVGGAPLDVWISGDSEMVLVVGADESDAFTFDGLDRRGYYQTYADDPYPVEVAEAAKESYLRGDFGPTNLRDRNLGTYCVTTRDDRNTATNVAVVRAHSDEEAVGMVDENLRRGAVTVERIWTRQDVEDFRDLKEQTEAEISWFDGK